ncbi:hypothetical protein CAPTEDRAFT_168607 [Capitella teleta]|uniref:NADH dehydrogenase [ubiquinone] 1 alpha subcomplex subunit 13 n=1 Tax=Capitella teleta TaxID=283909 RepID=R7UPY2_CAPTE|nr:hypothetical protein CAPTEDRAFT_168607 [Capitella teleta]|eukprot:ELU08255.1 hypothetical protein CAPTEDRAFT_168607 [Capitella teleta]
MAAKFRQEMPPPGGYGGVEWSQKLAKAKLSGYRTFGLMAAIGIPAWTYFGYQTTKYRDVRREMTDARIAMEPLYAAEQHRMYLKQLRKNRDDENELMKDRPDWETGKWEGKALYHNKAGRFIPAPLEEYYAHSDALSAQRRYLDHMKH